MTPEDRTRARQAFEEHIMAAIESIDLDELAAAIEAIDLDELPDLDTDDARLVVATILALLRELRET